MKRYIPFLYMPFMLIMLVKFNMEIDKPIWSFTLGFARLSLLRLGIVFSEFALYLLLKKYQTPKSLSLMILGFLAFPQPMWLISDMIVKIFPSESTYLFHGPYTFVGMALLVMELVEIINIKFSGKERIL